jgi:hypothetical protein
MERLKAIIYFGENLEYEVFNDGADNFIYEAEFEFNEGNNNVNPLGVNVSNDLNLVIMDINNYLSPGNESSPYADYIKNGVKIKTFISYDGGINFEDYGVWYVNSWSCGFSEGYNEPAYINCEDILNTIGNIDMPSMDVYNNTSACALIASVFEKIGLSSSDYVLDQSLDKTISYGDRYSKVRDFLNNMSQLMLARFIVDRHGVIRMVPALGFASDINELWLNGSELGAIKNKNTNTVDYNEIKVTYLTNGSIRSGLLYSGTKELSNGLNEIRDISFNVNAVSIDEVDIDSDVYIDDMSFSGFNNGINLDLNIVTTDPVDAKIKIYGHYVDKIEEAVSDIIESGTSIGGRVFEFDSNQVMTKAAAQVLMNNLKTNIIQLSRHYSLSGVVYTPMLYTGDKIVITDTGTMYDGTYKVITESVSFKEAYDVNLTLLKIGGESNEN